MKDQLQDRYEVLTELTKQSQELGLYDMTYVDADMALEMLDNPKLPNDQLLKLLELKCQTQENVNFAGTD